MVLMTNLQLVNNIIKIFVKGWQHANESSKDANTKLYEHKIPVCRKKSYLFLFGTDLKNSKKRKAF
jgi:hypothetical protein